jgi:molybdopterin synthase sulfur carrier subunit
MAGHALRIVVMPPFDKEFFGADRLSIEAVNLFDLVDKLDGLAPGFAAIAQPRVHLAVDGVLETDWTRPLAEASEVIVLSRVGGG